MESIVQVVKLSETNMKLHSVFLKAICFLDFFKLSNFTAYQPTHNAQQSLPLFTMWEQYSKWCYGFVQLHVDNK